MNKRNGSFRENDTVKPYISHTSKEFLKCFLANFLLGFILFYLNFSIFKNK